MRQGITPHIAARLQAPNKYPEPLSTGMVNSSSKHLVICSRISSDYQLTEAGTKHLQHLFTTWFPRAIYQDLTDDTVKVDVVVKQGVLSKKNLFNTSFLREDDSVIKTLPYDEDKIVGKRCDQYDQNLTHYDGQVRGVDYRHVYYSNKPPRII